MTQVFNTNNLDTQKSQFPPLALIGASAGGPQVLGDILRLLPQPLPFAIVIAQHLESDFMGDFISWLSRHSGHTCQIALENERPVTGNIYLADCHCHLVFDRVGRFIYLDDPEEESTPYHPGIDQLFFSAATLWPCPGTAALLTGMGSDGAKGLLQLREKGWMTAAQDEKSCLVYGMPKAAAELNAAMEILTPEKIAAYITKSLQNN